MSISNSPYSSPDKNTLKFTSDSLKSISSSHSPLSANKHINNSILASQPFYLPQASAKGFDRLSSSLIKADIIAQKVSKGDTVKNYQLAKKAKENAKQLIISLGCEGDLLPNYKQYLQDIEDSLSIQSENMFFPKVRAMWNASEDRLLTLGVTLYGANTESWPKIAVLVPGRTNKACRKRWFHSLDPTLHKGSWTVEEDNLLRLWVSKHPGQWSKIAKKIKGRTDDQCAKRWRESLDPNISREKWSPEEDTLLLQKYIEYGAQWQKIAVHFTGRPGLHCRNRWRKIQRKSQLDSEKDSHVKPTPRSKLSAHLALESNTPNLSKTSHTEDFRTDRHMSNFEPESFISPIDNLHHSTDTNIELIQRNSLNFSGTSINSSYSSSSLLPSHLNSRNTDKDLDFGSSLQSMSNFHNNHGQGSPELPHNGSNSNIFSIGGFGSNLSLSNLASQTADSDIHTPKHHIDDTHSSKRLKSIDTADFFLSQVGFDSLINSRMPSLQPTTSAINNAYMQSLNSPTNQYMGNVNDNTSFSNEVSMVRTNSSETFKNKKKNPIKRNKKSGTQSPSSHQREWLSRAGLKFYGCAALPGICNFSFYHPIELTEHLKTAHQIDDSTLFSEADSNDTSSKWNHIFRCGIPGCSSLYKNIKSLESHIFFSKKAFHYKSSLFNSNEMLNNIPIDNHPKYSKSIESGSIQNILAPENPIGSQKFNHLDYDGYLVEKAHPTLPHSAKCVDNLFTNYYLKGQDALKTYQDDQNNYPGFKSHSENSFGLHIDNQNNYLFQSNYKQGSYNTMNPNYPCDNFFSLAPDESSFHMLDNRPLYQTAFPKDHFYPVDQSQNQFIHNLKNENSPSVGESIEPFS
ncbi:hypothetical protein BB560_003249 [Smittium megazygosporum]|uniref:Transcriptional activator Myb n=1 Tax=Smittium megazygosporum TaxID=133381 RepID=A0A2T9ZCJ0_9FUNG|nr:hypothetical protein BB560_003249 [Smittium megazygosporum]